MYFYLCNKAILFRYILNSQTHSIHKMVNSHYAIKNISPLFSFIVIITSCSSPHSSKRLNDEDNKQIASYDHLRTNRKKRENHNNACKKNVILSLIEGVSHYGGEFTKIA